MESRPRHHLRTVSYWRKRIGKAAIRHFHPLRPFPGGAAATNSGPSAHTPYQPSGGEGLRYLRQRLTAINMIWPMPGRSLAISFIGVLIFAGLAAYDTQRLKQQYYQLQGTDFAGKAIVLGALSLYLDFVNMFQFLLSFMGQQRD